MKKNNFFPKTENQKLKFLDKVNKRINLITSPEKITGGSFYEAGWHETKPTWPESTWREIVGG